MFSKISSVIGCETWDASCDTIGISAAGTEAATRELDRTAGVWPLGSSVELVARRVPATEPFAPLVIGGGGGGGIVMCISGVVDK
jgi:hypothetical protein